MNQAASAKPGSTGGTTEGTRTTVVVEGRTLSVTNLDKVLFPDTATTKAEVMAYYVAVAAAILPQLRDRPVTRIRWPHGTGGSSFFEKNLPGGAPSWVPSVVLDAPGSTRHRDKIAYPLVSEVATLTWLSNLGALELHTPQWRVDEHGQPLHPDRLVVDLDPGPPAGLRACAQVALLVREALATRGLVTSVPVTSGSKGLQLYADLPGSFPADDVRALARHIAEELATSTPTLVVSTMNKAVRPGKVLLDWSQNTAAKTTITPYSLRGKRGAPYVAAPRTWAEVEAGAEGKTFEHLRPDEVLARLAQDGDLMAPS